MGCAFSKGSSQDGDNAAGGGKKLDPIGDPPEPPPADPRLPLTVRQRFSITKSWKGISREMERTGVTMFIK